MCVIFVVSIFSPTFLGRKNRDFFLAHFGKANPGTLQDCLLDLAATNDKGSVIPLDAVSQQRVAMHFHKKYAEMIGVPLTSIDLYRMAYLPGQQ